MKKLILLFLIGFITDFSFAQEEGNFNKNNSIYVEFYQPIQTPSLREFYNDEWILTPANKFTRHYFSNSVGVCYERVFKNNIIFRPRFGMTFRKLTERNFTNKYNTGNQDITIEEKYDYNQKHINLFLGLAKRLPLIKHFNLDLGVDLTSVFYLNGNTTYYSGITYYWPNTNDIFGGDETWWTNKVGKAYCVGVGPYIKPEYVFSNNLSISAEVQMYFMYSGSHDKSTTTNRNRVWLDPSANGGLSYLLDNSSNGETKYDFGQWSWSRLSPLIRIGYKF